MSTTTKGRAASAALAAVIAAAALVLGAAGPAQAGQHCYISGSGHKICYPDNSGGETPGSGGGSGGGSYTPPPAPGPGAPVPVTGPPARVPAPQTPSKNSTVKVGKPVNVMASVKSKTVKVTWRKPTVTGTVTGYEIKVGSKTYTVPSSSRTKWVKVAKKGMYTVKVRAIAKSANGKNRISGSWVTRTVMVR